MSKIGRRISNWMEELGARKMILGGIGTTMTPLLIGALVSVLADSEIPMWIGALLGLVPSIIIFVGVLGILESSGD